LNLLLDTHIWLWTMGDPRKVGPKALQAIRDPKNEVWLSPSSLWEALLLIRKGRVHVSGGLDAWQTKATARFREAPLTHEIAMVAGNLPLHSDPADRFLAATAKILGLTLVTADQRLLGLGDIATLANR
jgi:PIN domain nuclease of toxin-antitoxin system